MKMARTSMALALAATATADDLYSATNGGCQGMLGNIAAQGHSDAELAAYCRASMPPELCKEALRGLGQQPWSFDHIASTCQSWEHQWNAAMSTAPDRKNMDFKELQTVLDGCISTKAESNLCKMPSGKKMTTDRCLRHKQKLYPAETHKYNEALRIYYAATGGDKARAKKSSTHGGAKKSKKGHGKSSKNVHKKGNKKDDKKGDAKKPGLLGGLLQGAGKKDDKKGDAKKPGLLGGLLHGVGKKDDKKGDGKKPGLLGGLLHGAVDKLHAGGKAEATGPVAAFRSSGLYLLAGPGLAIAALAAGAAVFQRLRRRPAAARAVAAEGVAEEDMKAELMPVDPMI